MVEIWLLEPKLCHILSSLEEFPQKKPICVSRSLADAVVGNIKIMSPFSSTPDESISLFDWNAYDLRSPFAIQKQ